MRRQFARGPGLWLGCGGVGEGQSVTRIASGILGLSLGALCAPLFAQVAARPAGAFGEPVPQVQALQFDQLRLMVPAGQPLPPPDAFEQQYAAAQQALKADPREQEDQQLAQLRGKFPTAATIRRMEVRGEVSSGIAEGAFAAQMLNLLPRIAVPPVVGEIGLPVAEGIHSEVQRKHEEHLEQAMQQYMRIAMALFSRPQLLHVSVLGDRLRVENADTGGIVLVQPDRQRMVLLEPPDKTYTIQPLAGSAFPQSDCDAAPVNVSPLGPARVAGVPAQGYRFDERENSPAGGAMDVTITRYVSDYTLPPDAMKALLGTNCAPDSGAMRNAPGGADHLAVYSAFAHAAVPAAAASQGMPPGLGAMMSPQFVLWRGHLHTAPVDPVLFEIPADYKPAPAATLPAPATTAAGGD